MYQTNVYLQTIRKMCVRKVCFVRRSMRCHGWRLQMITH